MESHAYSDDDDESPVEFANEIYARQTQTPSPRTELLSPTSPRALQGEIDQIRRSRRGPSERFRRSREQTYANVSPSQLISLLIEKEYEANKLRKALTRAYDRVEAEASRSAEAERVTQQTLSQFRVINEGKVATDRVLAKTSEELRLWKFQFEHAQKEISRAQDVVQLVERQRDDAEQEATKARTTARQLHEQRLISDALEEGRQLGYKAGFRRAQQEMAYTQGATPSGAYGDMGFEPEVDHGRIYNSEQRGDDPRFGVDAVPQQSLRDINASPLPPARSPQVIRMPEMPPSQSPQPAAAPPAIPPATPVMSMPSPRPAPTRPFETESVRRAPQSIRSPSIQIDRYSIDIPSASVFNDTRPSAYPQELRRDLSSQSRHDAPPPPPRSVRDYAPQPQQEEVHYVPPPENTQPLRHRPSSQSQFRAPLPPPRSVRDEAPPSPRSFRPSRPPSRQEQLQFQAPPDNYIPSMGVDGGIALPPPFQLSQPILSQAPPPPQSVASETQPDSFYNPHPASEDGTQMQAQTWNQMRRPRSNAGSVTGRSNAGSITGHSASGRHTRHASEGGGYAKSAKLAGSEYGPYSGGLGAINEDARSARGSQRTRSMQGSMESLMPPPLPAKDARHQKQLIADELRYSNPDLAEAWRRDAAVNAETASTRSRPPRNVHVPAKLTMPAPLSPPTSVSHMRARSMSGSTVRSGRSQPTNMMDLASRPSLRRVKEKRPISPSDIGSPYSGTINVEPPSQSHSSSQIPLSINVASPMGQFLSPDYQAQPLPQIQNSRPAGFVPQAVTVPAEITMPVTFKGRNISEPIIFPTNGAGGSDDPPPQPRPASGMSNYRASAYGGSNTDLHRSRSRTSMNAPPSRPGSTEALPVPAARSTSNLSHRSEKADHVVGPTLTADGPGLSHRASNISLRSTASGYARFDAQSYVDPAYFAADTSAAPIPAPRSRKGSVSSHHSGLSYIGPG